MGVFTDVIRRVFLEDGNWLTVKPWPEVDGFVALSSEGNEDYFGRIEISMTPEFARQLGKALIACADDMELNKSQGKG